VSLYFADRPPPVVFEGGWKKWRGWTFLNNGHVYVLYYVSPMKIQPSGVGIRVKEEGVEMAHMFPRVVDKACGDEACGDGRVVACYTIDGSTIPRMRE
jgi:hypothetical protein